jgi:hypothetical protein
MAYQLSQSIYSMSIVASTCHWVFPYEVVNAIIFQCIRLFFTLYVLMQVRCYSHQWIPAMLCTCKCDEKCWRSQLSDNCKNSFLVLLQKAHWYAIHGRCCHGQWSMYLFHRNQHLLLVSSLKL